MLTKGTRWIRDRCTDLLPELARLAVAEWWHGRWGRAGRLDEHIRHEAERVLADLDAILDAAFGTDLSPGPGRWRPNR